MFSTKLIDRKEVAEDTIEFFLEKPSDYRFKAGQHTSVTIGGDKEKDPTHTFSYTSDPNSDHVSFMTRIRDSEFKKILDSQKKGNKFELSSPSGFEIGEGMNGSQKIVYFAAGIGITPLMSYLRSTVTSDKPDVHLVWTNKNIESTPHYTDFTSNKIAVNVDLNVSYYMTRTAEDGNYSKGRLNIAEVSKVLEESVPDKVYIIGMPSFVDDVWSLTLSTGLSDEKLITENFSGY